MMPATKTDPISKFSSTSQPTNAPKAPASFQSPAPRLRNKTKGSSTNNPNPPPSREVFNPCNPPVAALTATPTRNPGTVSQLGIRRLRQSVKPAASPKTIGFKRAPPGWRKALSHPQLADFAECVSFSKPGLAGKRIAPRLSDEYRPLLMRIFTWRGGEVNRIGGYHGERPSP